MSGYALAVHRQPSTVNRNIMHLWGIDLGGTKMEGVILESRTNPQVLHRLRIPTEAHLGYEHIVNQVVKLVGLLTEASGLSPQSLGIGHPGTRFDRCVARQRPTGQLHCIRFHARTSA